MSVDLSIFKPNKHMRETTKSIYELKFSKETNLVRKKKNRDFSWRSYESRVQWSKSDKDRANKTNWDLKKKKKNNSKWVIYQILISVHSITKITNRKVWTEQELKRIKKKKIEAFKSETENSWGSKSGFINRNSREERNPRTASESNRARSRWRWQSWNWRVKKKRRRNRGWDWELQKGQKRQRLGFEDGGDALSLRQ